MKTAIYIEDGTVQLVLTPESEFEKSALRSFEDKPHETRIFTGSFYDCRGGLVRQSSHFGSLSAMFGNTTGDGGDRSLILRATATAAIPAAPPSIDDYGASIRVTELVAKEPGKEAA